MIISICNLGIIQGVMSRLDGLFISVNAQFVYPTAYFCIGLVMGSVYTAAERKVSDFFFSLSPFSSYCREQLVLSKLFMFTLSAT